MEHIAEASPQELCLWMLAFAQFFEFQCWVAFFEDVFNRIIPFLTCLDIFTAGWVEDKHLFAIFFINAALGFLAEGTVLNQSLQPAWALEQAMPRVVWQRVLHGFHNVGKGV